MKFIELKQKLDEFVGIESGIVGCSDKYEVELAYRSPSGRLLFTLLVARSFDNDDSWRFGSISPALDGAWQDLCSMHRQ